MGSVGKVLKQAVSSVVSTMTYGTVGVNKGRVNVPFSSAATRTFGKELGNQATLGHARKPIEKGLDTKEARMAGTVIGSLAAAGAGAGAGGALGAASGAGGAAGSGGASVLGVTPL